MKNLNFIMLLISFLMACTESEYSDSEKKIISISEEATDTTLYLLVNLINHNDLIQHNITFENQFSKTYIMSKFLKNDLIISTDDSMSYINDFREQNIERLIETSSYNNILFINSIREYYDLQQIDTEIQQMDKVKQQFTMYSFSNPLFSKDKKYLYFELLEIYGTSLYIKKGYFFVKTTNGFFEFDRKKTIFVS